MKSRPKILSVVGARPQFIKVAPLASKLARWSTHRIVHTGQHYDDNMSSVFFRQLRIPRALTNLSVGGGGHGEMTGSMLIDLEKFFLSQHPDLVLVYGDTNSTLAGAIAAAKLDVPVAHVEAGLRSFNDAMPEEINRKLADRVSSLLFCPTPVSVHNLKKEGLRKGVALVGDLMYELLFDSLSSIRRNKKLLRQFGVEDKNYIYLTLHRASNVDSQNNLKAVIDILASLDTTILFSMHPRTKSRLREFKLTKSLQKLSHVKIIQPQAYLSSLTLTHFASHVMTDSGGLQKEAIFLGTPVLTLREETEWTETLRMGNRLTGLNSRKVNRSLRRPPIVRRPDWRVGGQRPSDLINKHLKQYLLHR